MATIDKLVRDRIPYVIAKNDGKSPEFKVVKDTDYKKALALKFIEEADELARELQPAESEYYNSENIADELADVYEVIMTLWDTFHFGPGTLREHAANKRLKLGGFSDGIWLI